MIYLGIDISQDQGGQQRYEGIGSPVGVARQARRCSDRRTRRVMEATGVYHEQAALWLADAGMRVSVVNPAQVRDFTRGLAMRTKTDGTDSLALARYGSLIPPEPGKRNLRKSAS